MNILVTGGAGFIGSNFLNYSVPRFPEHLFINLDKLTYAANLRNLEAIADRSNYTLEIADISDAKRMEEVFLRHGPTVVIHFAAESHVDRSIAGPEAFMRTNVEGTFRLLECCRRQVADGAAVRFHHISTDEVYGSLGERGLFTEQSPYDPSSPYSASKAASDHIVRAYGRTYGLPITVTNCSNNYGPYQFPEKLVPLMILNALERKSLPVYGNGANVRDWLHVADHCEAIWAVLERGKLGATYNVGGRSEAKNLDLVHRLCEIIATETGCAVQELQDLITFVPDRPGHDLRYAVDSTKLEQSCGWKPRYSLDAGLRETVRWYLRNDAWCQEVRSGAYQTWIEENYSARR